MAIVIYITITKLLTILITKILTGNPKIKTVDQMNT